MSLEIGAKNTGLGRFWYWPAAGDLEIRSARAHAEDQIVFNATARSCFLRLLFIVLLPSSPTRPAGL